MQIDLITADKGEIAWHDWCRSLKLRKPSAIGKDSYTMAYTKSLDAWHPEAFAKTSADIQQQVNAANPNPGPRRVMFDAIDWCGNVVGQAADCPYGPVGRVYHVKGLGVDPAGYRLTDYGLEAMPDSTWVWWLLFEYDKEASSIIYQTIK